MVRIAVRIAYFSLRIAYVYELLIYDITYWLRISLFTNAYFYEVLYLLWIPVWIPCVLQYEV